MKVIFFEDDRVAEVSEGYARNYLLPRQLAAVATPAALAAAAKRQDKKLAEREQKKAELQALADKLAAAEFEIKADAGEGGKLFGSITPADIAKAVKQSAGVELDRRKIELAEPLKIIGDYVVPVKLFPEVTAQLKVKVSAR